MKRADPTGKKRPQRIAFTSTLKCIAQGMDYFALPIPPEVTAAVGTHGPVPVLGTINRSKEFAASLYPVGGGRHYLRVRNQICKSVGVKEGSRVAVQITVRDRSEEVALPPDVARALRVAGVADGFAALPLGKRSFMLRVISEAVRPETRKKRIDEAVVAARGRARRLQTQR